MNKSNAKSFKVRAARGFTMVEVTLAMALSLILLAIAFDIFDKLNNAADLAGTMADVNENLRAGENMIARDVSTAGSNIPQGGIPLPSGASTCTPIQVPLPSTTLNAVSPVVFTLPVQYFNSGCPGSPTGNLNALTPGPGYGPTADNTSVGITSNSVPTDSITLISVNPSSELGEYPLVSVSPVTTAGKSCCFPTGTTSVTVTVNALTNNSSPITNASSNSPSWVQVVPGQLIMLTNNNGSVLLAVSSVSCPSTWVAGTSECTITFTSGDSVNDPLPFNQFPLSASSPTSGEIGQLQNLGTGSPAAANTYPSTSAYQITMTTYYLDNVTRSPYWMLMKQVGTGAPVTVSGSVSVQSNPPEPVAMGINVLQFAFSCTSTPCTPTDPTRTPANPSDVRKVMMWVTAIASHPNRKTGTYFTNSIATSVTAQNLAYYNQY